MSLDGPSPAPIKPDSFDKSTGTVTCSNPPIPLFVDDGQTPPEAYGLTAYTTRPPWMADNGSAANAPAVTKSYIVDGASLSPFEAAPASAGTAAPSAAEAAQPAPAAAPAPMPYVPYHAPRRAGAGMGALIKLFVLAAKLLPLAGVLVGGYYTYAYYFGPVPIVNRLLHPHAPLVTPKKSKVTVMMDMTRDVAARNNSRIDFANELAEGQVDLNTLNGPTRAPVAPAPAASPFSMLTATPTPVAPAAPAASIPHDELPTQEPAHVEGATVMIENQPAVALSAEAKPSAAFLSWVQRINVNGVRSGHSPRVFVDGVMYGVNDTVDFGLKIKFVGIDPAKDMLLFRDASGAMAGKRY